jgi:metal-responsive CopG/Arc/MetJ family transcriptional regulator
MKRKVMVTMDNEVFEIVEEIRKRHGTSRSRFIEESLRATFPKLQQAKGYPELLQPTVQTAR